MWNVLSIKQFVIAQRRHLLDSLKLFIAIHCHNIGIVI